MAMGQKSTHGGAREGAGRPKETLSQAQVREMLRKAKEWAEKKGQDIDDILLQMIHEGENDRDRLAAIKLWKEYTIAKIQEDGPTDRMGPAIYLPKQDKGPNVVSIK